MGNCSIFCSDNISKLKGDIVMDKLIIEDDRSKSVHIYNLYKIKFLQKQIKQFLNKGIKNKIHIMKITIDTIILTGFL